MNNINFSWSHPIYSKHNSSERMTYLFKINEKLFLGKITKKKITERVFYKQILQILFI